MEWRRRGAAKQPGRRSLHTHAHTHKHAGTIFFKKLKKQGVCLIRAIKAIFPQKGTDSGFREGGLISVESV